MILYAILKRLPDGSLEWYRGNSGNNYQIRVWEKRENAERYVKHFAKKEERKSLKIVALTIINR